MNRTFTKRIFFAQSFRKAICLLLPIAVFCNFALHAQTYLFQDFESNWTSASPPAPASHPGSIPAGQNWTQSRIILIGTGAPIAVSNFSSTGEVDWRGTTWDQTLNSWSSNAYTNATGAASQPLGTPSGMGAAMLEDYSFGPVTSFYGSRRIESPTINLTGSTSPFMRFLYWWPNANTGLNSRAVISTDGGTTWNVLSQIVPNGEIVGTYNASSPWQNINIPIPVALRTATVKVGIEFTNLKSVNNVFVDRISVEEFTPTTITSAQSGPWSAPSTWVGGVVPNSGNNVVIVAGHGVLYDYNTTRAQNITVNGKLVGNNTNSSALQVFGDLTIGATGLFSGYATTGVTGLRLYAGGNIVNNGVMDFSKDASFLVWLGNKAATYSGSGTLVNGFMSNIWHANAGGVTYNSPVEVRNGCGLYVGDVNPNGNLTLGNVNFVTTQTLERSRGAFTASPIYGANVVLNVSYVTSAFEILANGLTLTTGFEIPAINGTRLLTGSLVMNTHYNVQLGFSMTVGTGSIGNTGGLTLNRGILISTQTNMLTLNLPPGLNVGSNGAVPSTESPSSTHGSYVTAPFRFQMPFSGTTAKTLPVGVGTETNDVTGNPSKNQYLPFAINPGTTWAGQLVTLNIYESPSGTVNAPLRAVIGKRTYGLTFNGGPALSSKATVTLAARRYDEGLYNNVGDVLVAQGNSLTGPWTSRMVNGENTGIIGPTNIGKTTTIALNSDTLFCWGTSGPAAKRWIGGTTGNWGVAGNWSPSGVPTAADNVMIYNATVTLAGGTPSYACNNIDIQTTSTLISNADTLNINGRISVNGNLTVSGGSVNVNGVPSNRTASFVIGPTGQVTVSSGTLNVAATNGDNDRFLSSMGILNLSGTGILNINGGATLSTGTFNMSGSSQLNFDPQGKGVNLQSINNTVFKIANVVYVNANGGTITFIDPSATNPAGTNDFVIDGLNNANNISFTGSTIRFGDGLSNASATASASGFQVSIGGFPTLKMGNIIINNPTGTNRAVKFAASTIVQSLVVTAGSVILNGFTLGLLGDIINNGTIDGTTSGSILQFVGNTAQTVSGNGSYTNNYIRGLVIQNYGNTVSLNQNLTVTDRLDLNQGSLIGTGTLTLGNSTFSNTLAINRNGGLLGLTPVFNIASPNLVNLNLSYNAPATVALSYEFPFIAQSAYVAGNELPATDTINSLRINNRLGVTFNASIRARALSPLVLTNGIATFSGTNSFIATNTNATLPAPAVTALSWINGTVSLNINSATNINRSFPVGGSTPGSARTFTLTGFQNGGTGVSTVSVTPVTGSGNTAGSGLSSVSATRAFNAQVSGVPLTAVGSVTINYDIDDNLTLTPAAAGILVTARIGYSNSSLPASFASLRAADNITAGSVTTDQVVPATLGYFNVGLSVGNTVVTYVGPASGLWHTASNWSNGAVPTAADEVNISGNVTVKIASGTTANVKTLLINTGASLIDSASTFTIDSNLILNGSLTIRTGNMNVGGVFAIVNISHIAMGDASTLNLSGGTLTLGNAPAGMANRSMLVKGTFIMTGGILNIYGQISIRGAATPLWTNFTLSGGNINIYQQGSLYSLASVPALDNAESTVANTNMYLTGGTITIVDPNSTPSLGTIADIVITNGRTRLLTGTTFALGNGVSALAGTSVSKGFSINMGGLVCGNIIVNNPAGANREVRLLTSPAIFNNLTITAGTFNSNALGVTLNGNILNNGVLNFDNNSMLTVAGNVPQTISGTGTWTNNRISTLTISNSSEATPGVTLNMDLTITNALNMTLGSLGGTGTLTLGNPAASTTFTLTRTTGIMSLTPIFNFAGVTTTYNYNAPTPSSVIVTTGKELPDSVNTLTFNNASVPLGSSAFIMGSPVKVTTIFNLSGGIVQTSVANVITLGYGAVTPPAGGTNAYVSGPLAIQVISGANTSRIFAIGKAGQFRPLTLGAFHSNATLQTYTAEVMAGSTSGIPASPLNALTTTRYWKVSNTSNIFSTTVPTIAITTGPDDNIGLPFFARVAQGNPSATFNTIGGSVSGLVITSVLALSADTVFTIGTEALSFPKYWTGGANTSNWGDALNWSNNAVPTATDVVNLAAAIAPSGGFPVTININVPTANVGSLFIGPNVLLDMKNTTLTIANKYSQFANSGTVFANNATINMTGSDSFLVAGGIFNGGSSTLNFRSASPQWIRPSAGTYTFFNVNLTNGDKNFLTGSTYTMGGNFSVDLASTISLSSATNTTFNVGDGFINNAVAVGTNITNIRINMNGLGSVINSPVALTTPSIIVASGFTSTLAGPVITFNTGRTFTVTGRLNAGNSYVTGTGTFILSATGTLGTTQATGGLTATIDPGLTRTFTLGSQIDYNAIGAQVIDAASHHTNCGIRVSNAGTKTLNGNITIATTGSNGIQRGAVYAQYPAVFADGGFVITITGASSPFINIEKGAGYASAPGGGLKFGGTAAGATIRVPDGTSLGDVELDFATVSNLVTMQSSEELLISNVTIRNLKVGVTNPANGGSLYLSNNSTTHLTITGNYTIGNTGSTETGTLSGSYGFYTNITLNGNFSSANTSDTQTIISNAGFNTLIMNGTAGQSFIFSGASAVSYLVADPTNGLPGAAAIRINNPGNVIFGDGVPRTYTCLGVIEIVGNGTVVPGSATIFAYNNASGTLRYANTTGTLMTTDNEFPLANGPFNLQIASTGSGTVTLHASRTIGGTLVLQSGVLNTFPPTMLSLGSSNALAGTLTRIAGWINGPFSRWVSNTAGAREWPIGTANEFKPAVITFNSAPSLGGYATITYLSGVNGTPLSPTLTDGITLDVRSNAYWQIDTLLAGMGSADYNISLNSGTFAGINDPSAIRLIRSDDGGASFYVTGTHSNGATGFYNRNTVTNGFGRYYLAASNSVNPLPVKLISLAANIAGDDVLVSWATASENNNKGFEVERSVDGHNFEKTGAFVKGAGNSNVTINYSLTDLKAFTVTKSAIIYYRLRQIDFNGIPAYSNVIKVTKESDNLNALSAYPNPFSSVLKIETGIANSKTNVSISDLQGRIYIARSLETDARGEISLDCLDILPLGIYFLSVEVGGYKKNIKLIKQ